MAASSASDSESKDSSDDTNSNIVAMPNVPIDMSLMNINYSLQVTCTHIHIQNVMKDCDKLVMIAIA